MEFFYTWIPVYSEIITKISHYRNDQLGLINILKDAGVDSFNDRDSAGSAILLDEIDPFTFLCYLNKYGDARRKIILHRLCDILKVSFYAVDVCGIPTANAQKLWLFPFKSERINDEINKLWNFFEKLLTNQITDSDFAAVLTIVSVGKPKLSEVMYMVKPELFLCLNKAVKPYLEEKYQIDTEYNSYSEFQSLCSKIKNVTNLSFVEISYAAYLHKQFYNRAPNYYRIGSKDGESGKSMLSDMVDNNIISIGWHDIGSIDWIEPLSRPGIKDRLQQIGYYETDNRTASKKAGEIWKFYNDILPEDIIAVANGQSIKAIGKVISDNYVFQENLEFPHCRSVKWLKKDIDDLIIDEGLQTSVWQYGYPGSITSINEYLNNNPMENFNDIIKTTSDLNKTVMHLNTIFFGPPGTGKTYKLQQIIQEWDLIEKKESTILNYEIFAEEFTWWEIVAVALLELKRAKVPELKQHPLIKAKFNNSSIKNFSARLWSTLQLHTVEHCENVKIEKRLVGSLVFYKEKDSIWRLDDEKDFADSFPELVERWNAFKNAGDRAKEVKKYMMSTCHQSLAYEDFIEGIKPTLTENDDFEIDLSSVQYEIRKGIFYKACSKASQLAGYSNLDECLQDTKINRKEKFAKAITDKNIMVLFLDEINRCNVSAVFGELITLIENDKRLGAENEIADTILPYSQNLFGVPLNLYIIGTMNTADRSIEALDTALRRRFSFENVLPKSEILKETKVGEISLSALLTKLNERILCLLNADHLIGHSYFMGISTEVELKTIFKNNIIPLLQEYFYNDYGKIGLVLGSSFVEAKEKNIQFPKDFDYENKEDLAQGIIYTLIPSENWTLNSYKSIYED